MNTLEAIHTRKSVRHYSTQPVEKDKLEKIAIAGNEAAKAGVVHFCIITNAEVLDAIQKTGKGVMLKSDNDFLIKRANTPGFDVLYSAPAAIAVYTDKTDDPVTMSMNTANAACAAQNIMLAATELGLGSCYTASSALAFVVPDMMTAAGIPADKSVVCLVSLGYTNDRAEHTPRSNNTIHWCE